MICPNCGVEATFREHCESFTERHGLDCGPYETWTEKWLTCNACGEKTDDEELCDSNREPPDDPDAWSGGFADNH